MWQIFLDFFEIMAIENLKKHKNFPFTFDLEYSFFGSI
jgi:hypothetical protein